MKSGTGKVVLVTGGAGPAIGSAICRAAAARGFAVGIGDRDIAGAKDLETELVSQGHSAVALALDVSNGASVESAVNELTGRFGRVDGLVNSAGFGLIKLAADITEEEFDRLMGTDLRGAWLCTRAVIPWMIRSGGGSIVNIGSIHAFAAEQKYAIYAAAKAGLVGLTKGIAREYGKQRIRCNAVHPGLVDGPQTRRNIHAAGRDAETWIKKFVKTRQMLGYAVEASDIGNCAAFLLSDESRAITAMQFIVDGGTTALLWDCEEDVTES